MIDRLQGKAPPARNLCSVEPVSAQIPTLEHDVREYARNTHITDSVAAYYVGSSIQYPNKSILCSLN